MVRCTSYIKPSTDKSGDKWKLKFLYDVYIEIEYKAQISEHKVAFNLKKSEAITLQRILNHVGHLIWNFGMDVDHA